MKRQIYFTLLLGLMSMGPIGPTLAEAEDRIRVGEVYITMPTPAGYVRIDGKNPKFDRLTKKITPKTNKVLAVYGSKDDLNALERGEFPLASRTFNVQIVRGLNSENLSTINFQNVKKGIQEMVWTKGSATSTQLTKQVKSLQNSAETLFKQEHDTDVKFGPLQTFGVFNETPESLLFTTMMNTTFERSVKNSSPQVVGDVGASAALLVRNKVVFLYNSANYETPRDLMWAKESMIRWRNQVVSANPNTLLASKPSKTQRSGSTDQTGRILGKSIGFGIVALLFWRVPTLWKSLTSSNEDKGPGEGFHLVNTNSDSRSAQPHKEESAIRTNPSDREP